MTDQEFIEKSEQIFDLYVQCNDNLVRRFFDLDSDKMLDEKIEVLTALVEGVAPADIPNYYKVLENMPKKGIWD